jgi:hypothetical protein
VAGKRVQSFSLLAMYLRMTGTMASAGFSIQVEASRPLRLLHILSLGMHGELHAHSHAYLHSSRIM